MEKNSNFFSVKQLMVAYKNSSLPFAVHVGHGYAIQFANNAFLRNLGLNYSALNIPLKAAIRGIENSAYLQLLDAAFLSGREIIRQRVEIPLHRNGKRENIVLDTELHPILDSDGSIIALLNHTFNVTGLVRAKKGIMLSDGKGLFHRISDALSDSVAVLNDTQTEMDKRQHQIGITVNERVSELSESEEWFHLMADGTDLLIAVSNERDEKVYYNKKWSELTDRSNNELLEIGWTDLIHEDDREDFIESRKAKKAGFQSFTREFRVVDKRGEYQWMLCQSQPRHFRDGRFAGYVTSCVDITQRKLEELRKNEFISVVSHELKTPVTSLPGFIQVLQRKDSTSQPELKTALHKMRRQISRMMNIIGDFLSLTRLETGALLLNETEFDLQELLEEVIADQRFLHSRHHFRSFIDDSNMIRADREKLYSVFSNLLNNASKYSPFDTTVSIRCRKEDGQIITEVCDEGPGIPDGDLQRVFDKFYRSAHHPTVSGFGIGLYLCAEIVSMHGGSIRAENMQQGCRIIVKLPLNCAKQTFPH